MSDSIQGAVELTKAPSNEEQYIAFKFDPDPLKPAVLLLKPNGEVFVHGRLAGTDAEIFAGLKGFIEQARSAAQTPVERVRHLADELEETYETLDVAGRESLLPRVAHGQHSLLIYDRQSAR